MHKSGERLSLGVDQWHLRENLAFTPVNDTTKLPLNRAIDCDIVLTMGGAPMLSALSQCTACICGDYGLHAYFLIFFFTLRESDNYLLLLL